MVAAAALAVLLPTALNVPQSGPSTLAEFAPVPGAGDGRSDISDLGSAQSGGLGFGSGKGGLADEPPKWLGAPNQTRPRLKRCVGNPPRQTEDPLSPPCVAFFEGDNHGTTGKGVTRDEVTVLAEMHSWTTQTDRQVGKVLNCGDPSASSDEYADSLCRALMRYFNDRYQTYGRTVRLYSVHAGLSTQQLDDQYRPFAHVALNVSGLWPRRKIMSVGYGGDTRKNYQDSAPYIITFRADVEDQYAQTASYICQKLVDRPAIYADDPTLSGRKRKFGFLFTGTDPARKNGIRTQLKARCDLDITEESSDTQTQQGVAQMKLANVTTVIIVVASAGHTFATNHATEIGYFPEWFIPGAPDTNGIDINFHARTANPVQWSNAFGVTYDYRREGFRDQPYYRAYREGCPGSECSEPTTGQSGALFGPALYDAFNMLFWGIQAAGPRLTPENIAKGLHAIPARPSLDPYRPAAYFAPGNYSFVKDAMAIWWDPSGVPPGSSTRGCYRLPNEGRRFRAGEWPAGDGDVHGLGPCQADTFQ